MLSRETNEESKEEVCKVYSDIFYICIVDVCYSDLFRFVVSKKEKKNKNNLILSSHLTADICLCYSTIYECNFLHTC